MAKGKSTGQYTGPVNREREIKLTYLTEKLFPGLAMLPTWPTILLTHHTMGSETIVADEISVCVVKDVAEFKGAARDLSAWIVGQDGTSVDPRHLVCAHVGDG